MKLTYTKAAEIKGHLAGRKANWEDISLYYNVTKTQIRDIVEARTFAYIAPTPEKQLPDLRSEHLPDFDLPPAQEAEKASWRLEPAEIKLTICLTPELDTLLRKLTSLVEVRLGQQ